MKNLMITVLLFAPFAQAKTVKTYTSRSFAVVGQTLKLSAQAAEIAKRDLCVRAALVSVAQQYSNLAATVLQNVASVRIYPILKTVTVRMQSTPDRSWIVSVSSAGEECLALDANSVRDGDIGGVGGVSVHN